MRSFLSARRTRPPVLYPLVCTTAAVFACTLSVATPLHVQGQTPPIVTHSRLDPSRDVNFHAMLLPDTVYVGQQATYQIGVFLGESVRRRLRRNPEFVPPETRSLLVYDLPDAKSPLVGTIGGHTYEVHVFQRAFFALTPGRYDVPPSQLTYALPQSASFFSREESHSMRSEALSLVVLPVPTAGRPDDWAGAVGEWRARLRVDSSSGRVGNPLVVTVRIEGRGNVTLLPRPRLSVGWGSAVAADERVELDSTPTTLRGAKEFDWLVTPRQPGRQVIPAQRFTYFDPTARRFEVAFTPPVSVVVAAGDAVEVDSLATAMAPPPDSTPAAPVLTLRTELGSPVGFSWLRSLWFAIVCALAPIPAAVGAFRHRRRRPRPTPSKARQLEEAARGATVDLAALRRLTHGALRERLGIDVGLSLADGTLGANLRHEGVTDETASRAESVLRELDAKIFGSARRARAPDAAELSALIRTIDGEARRDRGAGARLASRAATRASGALAVLLCLLAVSPLAARQGDEVDRSWAAGQTAYRGRDFVRAERHFWDVTRTRPEYPNAWANLGTAAWMAADTARAVQGWQRALRRAPLDTELRNRLALVRAVQDRGLASVPYVPTLLPPILFALVWVGGWWLLARRSWAGKRIGRRSAWLVGVGAILFAAAAVLDVTARASALVVVARPEPLRVLPVLGADQGAAPIVGEIAKVLQRRGAWAQVRLDGHREGWIAAELLLPLGDD